MENIKTSKDDEISYNGHTYVLQKKCKHFIRWRCSKYNSFKCPCILKTSLNVDNPTVISLNHNHVHDGNINLDASAKIKRSMVEKEKLTQATPRQIYYNCPANVLMVELPKEEYLKRSITHNPGRNDSAIPCNKMCDGNDEYASNKAGHITSTGNDCNKNTKIMIGLDKSGDDEDGQRMLIGNNILTTKKCSHVDDDKQLVSSLSWKDLYPQVLASCVSLSMVIQPGINLAYSNNLLHHIPSLNKGQFSWITSILALCTPIGAFLIGLIMDQIGRKKSCLLTCLPLLAAWSITSVTSFDNVYMFYVSRMCAGIGGGMTTVGLVYVSEISHSSYKQLLLSLNSVFFSGGILIATSLAHLSWNVLNAASVAFTVINMVLITICMPESPVWLMKFKSSECVDEAKVALKWIYPKNDQVFKTEWNRLNAMSDQHVTANITPSFIQTMKSSPVAYKPMAILVGLLLLQQLSGAYPTISYALPILRSIVADDDETISQIGSLKVLGTIRFVSAVITCPLSFYVGRRPLLMFSCAGMALSSALITSTAAGPAADHRVPWALCGVMLYVFSSSLGVLVFPWTLTCELLSTPVRAVGGSLLVAYGYLLMFAVFKAFPYALAAASAAGVFLAFGLVSAFTAVYVYFAVPETLGKTFQEVEDCFATVPRK